MLNAINTLMIAVCLILPESEGRHAGERRCVVMQSRISVNSSTDNICKAYKETLSILPPDINIVYERIWTEELNLDTGELTVGKPLHLLECESK
jgi:hypothetical protein